jgi:O-antigen ligase
MFKLGGIGLGALLNLFILIVFFVLLVREKFKISKLQALWLPLLLIIIISITYSPFPVRAIRSLLVLITYMTLFLIPFHFIKTKEHYKSCLQVIVLSSFIPLLGVFYDFTFPEASTNRNGFRLFSTFTHPNIFAFYLVTVVSVCFCVIKSEVFRKDIFFRKLCMIILLLCIFCVLGTKTRSAWAVLALLILIYGIFEEKRYLLYLTLACFAALMVPSIQERVADLFQGNDTEAFLTDYEALNSYAWRKVIWSSAIEMVWKSPIFGYGFQSFMYYSHDFFLVEHEHGIAAHNSYIQLLFETGIVGLTALLWLLGSVLILIWKQRVIDKPNSVVLGLFVAYCLILYSDNILDYLVFNWYFWFFIGSFLAYHRTMSSLKP